MGESASNATISFLKGVVIYLTTTSPYTIGESAIAMFLAASLSKIYYIRSPRAHIDLHPKSPY